MSRKPSLMRIGLIFFTLFGWAGIYAAQPDDINERLAQADVQTGERIFYQCAACHNAGADQGHRIGPNLWEVVARPIASSEGFDYSAALQALSGQWDFQTLDRFLADPIAYAPGTKMAFPGIKDGQQRAHLLAYLRTLSQNPVALPASGGSAAVSDSEDPFGADWPAGPGREHTGYVCSACHSLALVKQQGLSRQRWDELLVWMTEKQGMPTPTPEQREQILGYLTTHFGDQPISTSTMPNDQFGSDWPAGPGRELTGYVCSACHSLALVKQQRLPRQRWDKLLNWMVEEQGMDEPEPTKRELILDYLATHFGLQ